MERADYLLRDEHLTHNSYHYDENFFNFNRFPEYTKNLNLRQRSRDCPIDMKTSELRLWNESFDINFVYQRFDAELTFKVTFIFNNVHYNSVNFD